MSESLKVRVNGGWLVAKASYDTDYPGIWIAFHPHSESGQPMRQLLVVESPVRENTNLRALVWTDEIDEDSVHEFVFKTEEQSE